MIEAATKHPMQKPLWDLEWAIHHAIERAERIDDEASEAWEKVGDLRRQLDEMLEGLA